MQCHLFDRSGRLVRLTNAGQVFLNHVERILAQFESARSRWPKWLVEPAGRCRLAAPSDRGLSPAQGLATLAPLPKEWRVQLMESVQLKLLEWVQQSIVDFSIVACPCTTRIYKVPLCCTMTLCWVVPKDHDFAARRIVKLAELVSRALILHPKGRADVSNVFKPVGTQGSPPGRL